MKGKFFFSFFLLFPVVLTAQIKSSHPVQKDITGVVWEVSTNDTIGASIPLATVQLLNFKDSSLVKGIAADPDGKFVFPTVPQNNYLLAVSFVGYDTRYINVPDSLFRLPKDINLGKILLKEQSFMLSEAVILGQAPEVVVKEDTLEYNPVAFKMEDGAVVEDLLKRMPGMEVDPDGNVTSAGKEVKRIFVNGKEFFGNDPKMATKNLTIDVIEKVQVIEKKSDMAILTGVDDGETETIINLTIKESRNKGWMGNVSAGMGALVDSRNNDEPRYNTRTVVNRFVGDNQTSIVINANNLGRGGNGIAKANSFGINTSNKINDRLKVNGNVRYNYNENLLKQHSFRTNLLIDSVSYRRNSSRNQNYTHNLTFNGKLEYKPDSLLTVVFSPRISYNHAVTNNLTNQSTMAGNADSTLVNQSEGNTRRETDGLALGGELTATRLFSKKGRRLSLRLNGNLNHNQGDGSNLSTSLFFLQQNRNKYLDQESETSSRSNSYSIRASYVEPLREHMTLQVYYDFRKNDTRNIKKTYDYDSINYVHSILNHDYSKSLSNAFITQTIGINLNGQHEKYYYNLGVNIVPSNTQSTNFIKEGASNGSDSTLNRIPKRKVVNYSPLLNLTYRFNRQTNLRFTYRGNTTQPSVIQLDPTPNNTNPLNLRTGNPDLLPSFTNSMSLRLNMNKREKQRSLTASVDYSFTRNQIIYFTSYEEETGIQHTKPINENGSWNTSGGLLYNIPIGSSKRFKFNTNTRVSYNNRIGYLTVKKQSQRNISGTLGLSENISMSYNKAWYYGQLRANVRFSKTDNTLEGRKSQENTNFGVAYNTQLRFRWNIGINSNIDYRATRGLSSGYNKDEVIWNGSISKRFLKGNKASVAVEWTDILQQRLSISRNVTANYIEDRESNLLTSYVLVSLSYRFNTMGGKKKNTSSVSTRQGSFESY